MGEWDLFQLWTPAVTHPPYKGIMITTQLEAQGMSSVDLKSQANEILSTLSEDQLLVVLAYARALAAEPHVTLRDNVLVDLLEDLH
jgi:hypothetical protein